MSIEQTNQLILLILNSVLMALLSAALLGGAWLRQNTLMQQLHQVRSRYRQLTHPAHVETALELSAQTTSKDIRKADLKAIREQRQRLNHQYSWSHAGMMILHVSLLTFSVSLFTLALRSLLPFDRLIPVALFLFTLGAAGLLIGTGCVLVDLAHGNSNQDSLGKSLGKLLAHTLHQWRLRSQLTGRTSWVQPKLQSGLSGNLNGGLKNAQHATATVSDAAVSAKAKTSPH